MKTIALGFSTALAAMLATAAPALAESGNTATGSTGVVQIGPVTASPTASIATPAGGAGATAPSGSTSPASDGANSSSGSTGVVQVAPLSAHPHLSVGHGGAAAAAASAPTSIGTGENTVSSSTGAVQVGGGNSSSSSTGAAQVSGTESAPSVTVTPPGGESTTVGVTAGVAGTGNRAGNSTGALQVGGGNTASGSTGSAQSSSPTLTPELDLATPPGTPDIVGLLSLAGAGNAAGLASALPTSIATLAGASTPAAGPAPVATAAAAPVGTRGGAVPLRAQGAGETNGVLGAAHTLAGRVVSGVLPFTGLGLALWIAVGLALVVAGASLWRRSAAIR